MKSDDLEELYSVIAGGCGKLADAICRPGIPWTSPDGGRVGDLTEAAIFVGQQTGRIADSISELADDIRDHSGGNADA